MAEIARPVQGGSKNTWGTELDAWLDGVLPGVAAVEEYGTVGTSDDTAVVQAALDSGKGLILLPPPPTICTVGPLTVGPGIVIQGLGAQGYYNATTTIPNANAVSRLKLKAGAAGALLSPNDGGANLATHVQIRDVAFDCNAQTQPAIDLPDQGASISRFWRIERCYVSNIGGASGHGVYIGNLNTACVMRDCIIFNGTSGSRAGNIGVGWYGQDGLMDNCYIGWFAAEGLHCYGGANNETFLMHGGGLFGNVTNVVVDGKGAVFEAVSIDHAQNDGAYVNRSCAFIGCTFHTNSIQTNNTWSNIKLVGTDTVVSVIGCRTQVPGGEAGANHAKYFIEDAGTRTILNQFGNSNDGDTLGTGWSNYSGTVAAPVFPASGAAAYNTTGADVQAFINTGGSVTVSALELGVTNTGLTMAANGQLAIRIPHGQHITPTYAGGTPTWAWVIG